MTKAVERVLRKPLPSASGVPNSSESESQPWQQGGVGSAVLGCGAQLTDSKCSEHSSASSKLGCTASLVGISGLCGEAPLSGTQTGGLGGPAGGMFWGERAHLTMMITHSPGGGVPGEILSKNESRTFTRPAPLAVPGVGAAPEAVRKPGRGAQNTTQKAEGARPLTLTRGMAQRPRQDLGSAQRFV